ncbi:sugar transporter [Spirochaetia bacterium]|nr:sugar transporter [Spirochaetia bacterium]
MTNSNTIPKIGGLEKFGFCAFSASNNIVYLFKSMYYLFFLTNVVKIDVYIAGTILTIGTIWDAVNDPLIGFWVVNHKFKSGERCRPLALWFSVPWAISVVLLFANFGLPMFAKVLLALVIYLVFELFNTYVVIPYNSMGGLATNLDADRRSINVARNLGACVGSGVGAVACMPLLKLFGALDAGGNLNDNAARGFLLVAIVMGLIVIAGCLVHYFTTEERVKPIADEEEKLSAKTVVKMLLHSRSWVLNTIYIICYNVINLLLMTCITYYATYILGSTAASTMIQAAYLVTSIITTLLVGTLDQKLGRKRLMIIAILVSFAGRIWLIADPFNIVSIYICAIGVGFSVSIAYVMMNTNRNNIVDLIEWKDGRRIDSLVSTADGLASKLASAGATQLIAISLSVTGFNASLDKQPDSAINTIILLLGWAPFIVSVVMLVVVLLLDLENELRKMWAEKVQMANKG